MALTLIFSLGREFYIQDDRYVVTAVGKKSGGRVKGPDGTFYDLSNTTSVELTHGTRVSEGPKTDPTEVRIVFEASPKVTILRGDLYRERRATL